MNDSSTSIQLQTLVNVYQMIEYIWVTYTGAGGKLKK
jgi:hypothetical protein